MIYLKSILAGIAALAAFNILNLGCFLPQRPTNGRLLGLRFLVGWTWHSGRGTPHSIHLRSRFLLGVSKTLKTALAFALTS